MSRDLGTIGFGGDEDITVEVGEAVGFLVVLLSFVGTKGKQGTTGEGEVFFDNCAGVIFNKVGTTATSEAKNSVLSLKITPYKLFPPLNKCCPRNN